MKKRSDSSSFWVSYGDLMTSLFFVMLVLVVLFIAAFQKKKEEWQATEAQVQKLKELEEATKDLNEDFFAYDDSYKKFVLKIPVQFPKGSSDFATIPFAVRKQLEQAGRELRSFMQAKHTSHGVDFILVIEGQASRDNYLYNRELSYHRALALYRFWTAKGINFESDADCKGSEVLVVGSGNEGKPRSTVEHENQRFLITLINKPGIIK